MISFNFLWYFILQPLLNEVRACSFQTVSTLNENANPLDPAYIGCVDCDPFFSDPTKEGVFYIV